MTSPKHATSTARGRQYRNPQTGETYTSVTTILGQIGKADALKWWAAGEVAKYAVVNRDNWLTLDPDAAIDLLKREPLRSLSRAADRGTDVHAIADYYMTTGQRPQLAVHTGYVQALLQFVEDHQPQPLLTEATVYSSLGYAGSFDMVCKLPALDNRICVLDYKTSKAVYPDTAAQLAAYANAEQYIDSGDQLHDMIKVDTGVIVRFGADGDYEVVEADLDAGWQLFQAALAIHRAQQAQLLRGKIDLKPQIDNSEMRANITSRAKWLADNHPTQFDLLRRDWIADLPPLTSDQPILRHQLHILDERLSFHETQTDAPFSPMPQQKPKEDNGDANESTGETPVFGADMLPIAPEEIELVRAAINRTGNNVRKAIKQTTEEAAEAGHTLNLKIEPTIRRATIAWLMIDCFKYDHTRQTMEAIINHLGVKQNTIGAALAACDIDRLSEMRQLLQQIEANKATVNYNSETDTLTINTGKQEK